MSPPYCSQMVYCLHHNDRMIDNCIYKIILTAHCKCYRIRHWVHDWHQQFMDWLAQVKAIPLTHAHTYRNAHIYTCKHALTLHAHTHARTRTYACTHTCKHAHTCTRTHVTMHVCTHARTHAHTCMYVHSHVHIPSMHTHHKDFIYWSSQATKRVWRSISHKRAPVNGGMFVRLQPAHVTQHTSYFKLGLGKALQEQEEVDRLTVV